MSNQLVDKVAIVTGAACGLGRAIALAYAEAGAYVVCGDINASPNKVTVKELGEVSDADVPTHELLNTRWPSSSSRPRSIYVACDTSQGADVEELVNQCVAKYGGLDIMVNNAGIAPEAQFPSSFRLHDFPEDVWDRTLAVNGKGVWLGCKYAARQMLRQEQRFGDRGWIINIGSVLAVVAQAGASCYCASKGAVSQMVSFPHAPMSGRR